MASASGRARAVKMEKNDGNGIAVGTQAVAKLNAFLNESA